MVDSDNYGDVFEFQLSEADLYDYEDTFNELNSLSNQLINQLEPFDGNLEHNNPYQIRTGVIQDPRFEIFQNRVDNNGKPVVQRYSVLTEDKERYPLNGINAVDVYGMRVAIRWLDGDDGGVFNDGGSESSINVPVQKLFLTFPQAWADLDRNCGDFSLPVVGTIIRVGMIRNNMGVYLGSIPSDKAKLPILRLGDFLRKHYCQNAHYITDNSTKDAYNEVLDKDVYKTKPIVEPRPDTTKLPKPHETNIHILENLHNYHAHRQVIAKDGISTSAKESAGKHCTVCAKRTFEFNTRLNLSTTLKVMRDICHPTSVRITCPHGNFDFQCIPEGNNPANLTKASFRITTTSLTLAQIADIIDEHFETSETVGIQAITNDAVVSWSRRTGYIQSSITSVGSLKNSIEKIMGRSGKWYTISGPDKVITGSCPRDSEHIDTCGLSND